MRWLIALTLLVGFSASVRGHHPDSENVPVHPRIDLIPPLGTRLPPSYRRVYNRPTYLGGKIAYLIAPSSQEAMAWHDAAHRRAYKDHRPRIEKHFFFPKPWESIRIGARIPTNPQDESSAYQIGEIINESELDAGPPAPTENRPLIEEPEFLEN